ncbi:MAG TPA: hypothetical protein VH257_03945, partial [Chloroflexota bacterium]|nr:hypothetical protein [Chloroflexota bacterium]
GQAPDSPETLGLLAHELTHVARRRDPLFVPPLLRPAEQAPASASEPPPAAPESQAAPAPPGTGGDDEALAGRVESRVRQVARAALVAGEGALSAPTPALPFPAPTPAPSSPAPTPAPPSPASAVSPTGALPQVGAVLPAAPIPPPSWGAGADGHPWGGLPAPWEPLPGWLVSAPAAAPPATPATPAGAAPAGDGPASAAPAGVAVAIDAAPLQRALEDQPASSEEATSPAPGGPAEAPAPPGQPQPDLDALARQVYTVLKRRLAAERRRVD